MSNSDLFKTLDDISSKRYQADNTISPVLLSKWVLSSPHPLQIHLLSSFVSNKIYSLSAYPDLLWKLLCIASSSKKTKYSWILKKDLKSTTLCIDTIRRYFRCDKRQAAAISDNITDHNVLIDMAEELGYPDDKIKQLLIELK